MLVSNKKEEFQQRKRIKVFCDFCVRTDSIFHRGAGRELGRCKQLFFSRSIFGIWVERLSVERLHFCSDLVTVLFIVFVHARAKKGVTDFLISTCEKKLRLVKADQVE